MAIWHAYKMAMRDHRAGDSAFLLGAFDFQAAVAAIEFFSEWFPDRQSQEQALVGMRVIDAIRTEKRGKIEEAMRKEAMEKAKNQPHSPPRRRK